ncbi:pyrimidine 5'-nucleotidase [Iodidimonas gelatinilytica]|nr:pyrimidine 5'-nucleotidase [Iodidimonas gelatinilytica]
MKKTDRNIPAGQAGLSVPPRLFGIETWVFDLDNTLYSPDCDLFSQIDVKMSGFVADLLGLDLIDARKLQKQYFLTYGTTLRGLMDNHGVRPEDFLDHVHDIDVSPVPPDPHLAEALAALPGRKLVFTNGSVPHAERVMKRLGIDHLMEDVFDIAAADYHPKPAAITYDRFLSHYGVEAKKAVMFEDMARNLVPAAALGMTTVWLKTAYQWGHVDHVKAAVHHETEDLVDFLRAQSENVRD